MHERTPKIVYWRRWEATFIEPKTGTLKYALLHREKNGFSKCVRIINKRIYLDVESTFEFFNASKDMPIKEKVNKNDSGAPSCSFFPRDRECDINFVIQVLKIIIVKANKNYHDPLNFLEEMLISCKSLLKELELQRDR